MTHPLVSRSTMFGLALGLGLLVACSSADQQADKAKTANNGPEKRDTTIVHEACDSNSSDAVKVDANGDGKQDIIHVMKGGKEVCRVVDLNMDGAPDAFIYYDDQGRERRRESDFDRDGRADEIAIFENGQLKLKMRETNFDNKIDTWDYFDSGRLVKRERDTDGDGIVDQWWTFNNPQNPKCAIVASDRNADGKPDPDSVVDLCGESYGAGKTTPSLTAAAPGSTASSVPSAPSPGEAPPAPPSTSAPPNTATAASPSAPPPSAPLQPQAPKK